MYLGGNSRWVPLHQCDIFGLFNPGHNNKLVV